MSEVEDRGGAQPVRFGLVGAGRIGQTYAEAFQTTTLAKLVAVSDVRENAAELLAEPLRAKAYLDHKEMMADHELDAVVICTPPATHKDLSIYFIENGVNVLCEKPVCLDSDGARLIRDRARKSSRLFTMASKFRYVEDVMRAKSIVASGILGDLVLFENKFTGRVDMTHRWNSVAEVSGGGVLIDNGTHSLDLMRYFLGPLSEISVTEAKRIQGLPVEETVHIHARSESGVLGSCELSWSISKVTEDYITIYGSQGSLRVGWKTSSFQQQGSSSWVRFGNGYDKVRAFQAQINNFAAAIRGTENLLITAEDAVASVVAVEAGYEALRQGGWSAMKSEFALAV